eukprot:8034068-Heterocapsa_arctica.AAC.1
MSEINPCQADRVIVDENAFIEERLSVRKRGFDDRIVNKDELLGRRGITLEVPQPKEEAANARGSNGTAFSVSNNRERMSMPLLKKQGWHAIGIL